MTSETGESTSLWMATADVPTYKPLDADLDVDVCVVGAGIAGLSTAYILARQGKRVVVIDDGPIASGQTRRTTGHLSVALDHRYYEIASARGKDAAHLAADSHTAAIDLIEQICRDEAIDAGFARVDGYLFLDPETKESELDKELDAAHRAGLDGVEKVERPALVGFEPGVSLRFPGQARFHVLKYMAGLARAVERLGGRIATPARSESIEDGPPARVHVVGGRTIRAGSVVVATNSPIDDTLAIHTKQAAYLTYAVALRVPKGSITDALYWDTADPYTYVRLEPLDDAADALIVGGEDHKTGQADDSDARLDRLESWARARFATAGATLHRWSGQVMNTLDGLAFIGPNPGHPDHILVATGDSGNGLTHGTIAGMLLSDLILKRANPWTELYGPSRKPIGTAGTFLTENLNVAAQFADWLTPGDVKTVDEIPPGSGAIVRRGLKKIAAYRDDAGVVHERSAVCPHLGCLVRWNSSETTFDCPCHGSRFDRHGTVVNGPSNQDLARLDAPREARA